MDSKGLKILWRGWDSTPYLSDLEVFFIGTIGYIHSVETLGTLEGPGIRTVFFMQGCPLRCKYCHNPDTWETGAGRVMTPEQVRDTALRYREYYGTEGGVTFSGGEPLLQAGFVTECIKLLNADGIGTYIDTSGAVSTPEAFAAIKACEGVILDIKHSDKNAYKLLCGGNLVDTITTLEYIIINSKKLVIRQVIVTGINDDTEQVRQLKSLARGAEIELLAYHTLGVHKWEKLNMPYGLQDIGPPSKEKMDELKRVLNEK